MDNKRFQQQPPPSKNPFASSSVFIQPRQIPQPLQQQQQGPGIQFYKPNWIISNSLGQPKQTSSIDKLWSNKSKSTFNFQFSNEEIYHLEANKITEKGYIRHQFQEPPTIDFTDLANTSKSGCIKALLFCFDGYASVEEGDEMAVFLIACCRSSIEKPLQFLSQYLEKLESPNQNNYFIPNSSSIILLEIFIDSLQYENVNNLSIIKILRKYNSVLMEHNPEFYVIRDPQLQFNTRLLKLSDQSFRTVIADHASKYLSKIDHGYAYISYESVHFFYQLLDFYYSSTIQMVPRFNQENVFGMYYQTCFERLLTKKDKLLCIQFLPRGSDLITNEVQTIINQNEDLLLRQKALINILIAQKAQNIAISSYKNEFTNAYKAITGHGLEKDIEDLITSEIQRLMQQQQQ